MPKSKEQYEEIRSKSKKVITDTALNLFVTNGYHATSISAIAKEAGIAIGLMYNYFDSKEAMLIDIIEENMNEIMRTTTNELSKAPNSKDIHLAIDILFTSIIKMSDSWRLIITVLFQPDVANTAHDLIGNFALDQQKLYLEHFKSAGVKNPEDSAKTLFIIIHNALISYALTGNNDELQTVRKNVIDRIIDNGI